MNFFRRIKGAFLLDAELYEEVEHDRRAIGQAVLVVGLSSIAAGAGWSLPENLSRKTNPIQYERKFNRIRICNGAGFHSFLRQRCGQMATLSMVVIMEQRMTPMVSTN